MGEFLEDDVPVESKLKGDEQLQVDLEAARKVALNKLEKLLEVLVSSQDFSVLKTCQGLLRDAVAHYDDEAQWLQGEGSSAAVTSLGDDQKDLLKSSRAVLHRLNQTLLQMCARQTILMGHAEAQRHRDAMATQQ